MLTASRMVALALTIALTRAPLQIYSPHKRHVQTPRETPISKSPSSSPPPSWHPQNRSPLPLIGKRILPLQSPNSTVLSRSQHPAV
ncbi:hypothetical protein BGX38DRAFT_1230539 [Terfezia claveryi]|nr:hypothetical protein BGX38DRAFT_1230539 [Terfezia claveryi]